MNTTLEPWFKQLLSNYNSLAVETSLKEYSTIFGEEHAIELAPILLTEAPATEDELQHIIAAFGINMPDDLKTFYKSFGGIYPKD
jgi:hypothetical protein